MQFQKLTRTQLNTLVQWAALEGWNPGPHDAEIFWQTDPDGFWGYVEDGKLIAGGSIVSYDGAFGFMGFFIVKPEHRGRGLGRALWMQRRDMLLSRLNPGAAIGMDGVLAMQPFYARGGFNLAFRDERYVRKGEVFDPHPLVGRPTDDDTKDILLYDELCFGFPRQQFLLPWLRQPDAHAFIYRDTSLRGFAVLRKANAGYKIGPLFADDQEVAEALYRACLNAVPGENVYLDIPVSNPGAVSLVKQYDAEYVFECGRMYYGEAPALPVEKVYGVTTFELG